MASPVARLYIRVRLDDGSRPCFDPVFSGNRKLKALYAKIDGKPVHRPEGVYYLRYLQGKKRVFERVGSNAQDALTAQVRRERSLGARSVGLVIADDIPPASLDKQRRPLADCIVKYLTEIKAHKSAETHSAYIETLVLFLLPGVLK